MREIIENYRRLHKDTDHAWKVAVIEKSRKDGYYVNDNQDIDWLYDDAIYYLFDGSTTKINNLAKKLGYKEPPCEHCKKIIKFWNHSDQYLWSPEKAHLFESA